MSSNFDFTMGKTQISDIFQVSINSHKLISILKLLQQNHKQLETKIDRIDDYYKQGDSALNRKILNIQILTKSIIKQQLDLFKSQLQNENRKKQQKHIKQCLDKQTKIKELKYSIQTLNDKINKQNTNLTDQIQLSIKNYSTQIFALKRNFQKSEDLIQGAIQQIAEKIEKCNEGILINKQNIFDMEIKLKKYTDIALKPGEFAYIPCPDKKFEDSINQQKYSNFVQNGSYKNNLEIRTFSKDYKQFSRSANKKSNLFSNGLAKKSRLFTSPGQESKTNNQNYMSTLQYASISAKVESLQKKFQQNTQKFVDSKQNQNRQQRRSFFQRSGKTNMMKTFSFSKDVNSSQKIIFQKQNLENMSEIDIISSIFNKLEAIGKSMDVKEKQLKRTIQQIKEKNITSCEKIDFFKQKQSKIASEISQIKIKMINLQKKASRQHDTLAIANIELQLGKIIQRLNKEYQQKLNANVFDEEKTKMCEKISFLQQNLIYKAEKDEVKKAINFLQDKIKQIILVMANEFNQQTQGAISKVPTKCLTCDKEVLKLQHLSNMASTTGFKGVNAKTSRELGQKYYTRLLKSKGQARKSKRIQQNYTSATQVTQQKQQLSCFK